MANFWMNRFRSSGWPEHTDISIQATEGRNGGPFNGSVQLAMRKGDDESTEIPIDNSGQNMIADFNDGRWEVRDLNLTAFNDQGYDTLVFNSAGRKVPRTFRQQQQQRGNQPPRPNQQQRQDNPSNEEDSWTYNFSSFDKRKPTEIKDPDGKLTGYNACVYGSVVAEQGGGKNKKKKTRPGNGVRVHVFRDANEKLTDDAIPTDEHGQFTYTVRNIPPGGFEKDNLVKIFARVEDHAVSSRPLDIDVPLAPKAEELTATTMTAMLAGSEKINDGKAFKHTVKVLVRDQKKKGMGNVPISWTLGSKKGMTVTSDDASQKGWTEIAVEVEAGGKETLVVTAPAEGLHADPIELTGPNKPKVADKIICHITTSKGPDEYFSMTVATFCKEDAASSKFEISGNAPFSLKDSSGKSLGTSQHFPGLKTDAAGKAFYYIKPEIPEGTQMNIVSNVPDGIPCQQPIGNLTLKRKKK